MNLLNQILAKLRTRAALIAIAIALVLLNVGRLATNQYLEYYKGIESKQALLGQYQISTKNIETMRKRINQLEAKRKKIESYMFTGDYRREIASAMQIKIQELLSKAKLSPESLRPSTENTKDKDKQYGDIVVKVRLTGELENISQFLAELYKLNYLFKLDDFTLKPFKNSQLKVSLDLRGFYKLTSKPAENNSSKKD